MTNDQAGSRSESPKPTPLGRLLESAGTINTDMPVPVVDYRARHHAGQRPPFHAIPAIACYLLLIVSAAGLMTYAIKTFWWGRAELVSTHGLLPNHRLNKPVTATAMEMGPGGRERLLVADNSNLFVGSPIKSLRYWQWFPLEELGHPLAGSTIRGLSASDGKVAIVPENGDRRGLLLGTLPRIGSWPALWNRAVIDMSYFPHVSDTTARAALYDRISGDWLIGALNVAPYNAVTRQWRQPLLRVSSIGGDPQINELTTLGDGMMAALGAQGVDTLRWIDGDWRPVSHLGLGDGGLRGAIPRMAQFSRVAGRPAGTGGLTYLSEAHGLGQIRLVGGRIEGVDEWIGEGRADGISRKALTRAIAGVDRESAWMLYRAGASDDALRVALYRFKPHQMLGLPAGRSIPIGAGAIITPDPSAPQTAWVGGRGLFAVNARPNRLEAVDAQLAAGQVEEVAPARDTIFAAAKAIEADGTPSSPVAVMATPRNLALSGRTSAWSPFIGSRRLDSPLALTDITAATNGALNGHDSLILGTRKDGIIAFDRESRELFRPFTDAGSAAIVAPGTLDLHARGRSMVQVASDHSVNFYDGKAWQRLITASGTDLVPNRLRAAVSSEGQAVLVLSDGQSNAAYDARTHEWHPLPRLEVGRMVAAVNSLWAVTPAGVLHRLPFSDPKQWRPIDSTERVIDLHAQPDMIAVLGQRGASIRVWVMKGDATEPKVVFESNESVGDPAQWRMFTVHEKQLFVAPHNGVIGHYDGETHRWSSISLPPGGGTMRDFVATDRGLWLVDGRGLASFRPHEGSEWTTVTDRVQRLRVGTDEHNVMIQTADGRVLVGEGANSLRTIVGAALSTAPEKISTGVFFKGSLIVASDAGVHRYDVEQHDWENAPRTDPIIEFAHSAGALYARTRAGAVLLWNSNDIAGWEPVNDARGRPIRADHLAGSGGSYVVAASRESGVSAVLAAEPTRAKPLLLGSRLQAAGTISAAIEIDQELVIGTTGGAVSIYERAAAGPREWTNGLTNPGQTGPVRALLAPRGRGDRLIVVGTPQPQTTRLFALERPRPGQRWAAPQPVLGSMTVADAVVDASSVFAIDTRDHAPMPLARGDLATWQETAIIGAAFPGDSGGRAPTRAIGLAAHNPDVVWRADQAGRVAGYSLTQHSWQQSSDIRDVDRFFNVDGKLWSWSRSRGTLAVNDGKSWRPDRRWREAANDSDRLVLIGQDGNVVVRDQRGERTILGTPAQLPMTSAADIIAEDEYDGRLFIATRTGIAAYKADTHRWEVRKGVPDVRQFAAVEDGSRLYARTATGELWRLNRGESEWSRVTLFGDQGPAGQATSFVRLGNRLIVIDGNGEAIELAPVFRRLRELPDDIEYVVPQLKAWQLERGASTVRLRRALGNGSDGLFVDISLTADGFGFDRAWAVGSRKGKVQLYTEDGLVELAGDEPYTDLPNLDSRFARRGGQKGTAEVFDAATDGKTKVRIRSEDGIWEHDGQNWRKANTQDLQRVLEHAKPMFWDDEKMSWSRDDVVTLKLPGGPAELSFRVSSGRFGADQPVAIAVDQKGIVILTPAGVVRYGVDFSWHHISWPMGRPPADIRKARLVTSPADVILETDNGLFRWSDQGWSQLGRAEIDVMAQSAGSLLDGRFWRVSRRQGGSEIDIAMRVAEDRPFARVSIADGRFDFEAVRDVAVASGALWIATQFGMVQLDPATQEIKTLHKTEVPVSRLATLEETVAAQLEGSATLIYRDGQWQPGGSRDLFAEADRLVVQGGPWQWWRSPAGPKVQLKSEPSSRLWTASKPLEVRFSSNRFAFDDVRDAAVAERPWLATAAGLVGRSGSNWMQIDPLVPGQLTEGKAWSGVFAIGTPETDRTLFARINDQVVMLVSGEWRPASDAVVDRSLIREQGVRNASYEITRPGGRVQVRVKFADDPPGHYVPAVFDRALRRFRHDMPSWITRDPADSGDGLLVATRGGILAVNLDRNVAVRLYADPVNDGIGTEEIKALVHLPAAKRSLALLANGRIARLDAGATRWTEAGAEDSRLLDTARRVPQDDPNGWRIEIGEGQLVRVAWRGQPAILVTEASGPGQGSNSTRFAHDVANSAFIEERSIVIGTRGGIVRIPLAGGGIPVSSQFALMATDVLTPVELAQRGAPRGISFLRQAPNGSDVYARRDTDRQALRLFATGIQTVPPADANLAASQVVAQDAAWTWTKGSSAPVQMTPSGVFRVPAGYNFLGGRTWSFLNIDQTNRRFPYRTMVTFGDDLFMATAGGVSRFATSSERAAPSGRSFITAVYAEARSRRGKQPMIDVIELYVTERGQLMARTRANESFAFDPKRDEWDAVPADADLTAELFRVADTPLLDWRFDEAGQHSIVVRPLAQDLKDQSTYPLFSNGRFAFDDVRAMLHVEDELWLATGGGVCIYNRREFAPRRFIAGAFLDGSGAPPRPSVRELVRDPDRRDRIVARMDSGIVLEANTAADFRRTAIPITGGLDVFERSYMRKAPDPGSEMRVIQYPVGSYRFPRGALRARFRDSAGNWVELGNSGDERMLPLFSTERFAFDDVRDAILDAGRLLVATPVGIVTNRLDWERRRASIRSIDVGDGTSVPGRLPALHDMQGIVRMPSGAVIGWNNDQVFRLTMEGGRTVWRKERDQDSSPVTREQVLAEPEGEWSISLGLDGAAKITRIVGGREAGEVRLGSGFSDVSRPISDREWIYLPSASAGLIQIEKAGIR